MRNQTGISNLLAAAASLLVVGMLAVGTPALAQSEEDLAAPPGSFVSTMAVPPASADIRAANLQSAVFYGASEEDAAVPPGSFTTAMAVPEIEGEVTRLAGNDARQNAGGTLTDVILSEIVAHGLE
jgi:hypothetical protein